MIYNIKKNDLNKFDIFVCLFVCFFTIIKKKITNPGLDWRCFGPMKFWTETLYSKWEVMYSPTGVLLQYYATIESALMLTASSSDFWTFSRNGPQPTHKAYDVNM